MRTTFFVALAFTALVPLAAQQQQQQPAPNKSKSLTLSGCVARDADKPDQYTFTSDDEKDSSTYRLTGVNAREYVGKRVEVVGVPPKMVVKGGLYPTPNVAAQAGAMDPSKAAVAAATAGPAGTTASPLPEFRIQSIKPVEGKCPEPAK